MRGRYNRKKLERYRISALELAIIAQTNRPVVAGDIRLGPKSEARSIRFSIEEHDPGISAPFVSLSAEGHRRCSDRDVARFCKYAECKAVREITHHGSGTSFVRSFEIEREP